MVLMIPATSCCFQEDAACVIISEGTWRPRPPTGGGTSTEACGKESYWKDQLLLFLGHALVLTRHTLYVLVCMAPVAHGASYSTPPVGQGIAGHDGLWGDAAAIVSCGSDAWQLCLWLSAKLGDLTRRLELTVSPIVLPWETEQKGAGADGKHWVLRARTAVTRHYLLTVRRSLLLPSRDEDALACAVPLVLDHCSAFTSRDVCDFWPRHCRLSPLHENSRTLQLDQAFACTAEENGQCVLPDSQASSNGGCHGVETNDPRRAHASFKYTVVAGTFDRLHAGHQLLLAAAALATDEHVGLAVAAGPLVEKKVVAAEDVAAAGVEPFSYRLQVAAAFLQLLAAARGREMCISGFREALVEEERSGSGEQQRKPAKTGGGSTISCGLEAPLQGSLSATAVQSPGRYLWLHVFRITDAVGPADRLAFDCLVVSTETMRGAKVVNEIRRKIGNEPVSVLVVELVPTDAQTSPYVAEVLSETLPFTSAKEGDERKNPDSGTLPRDELPTVPYSQAESQVAGQACEDALTLRGTPGPPVGSQEASRSKLSSTELRYLQWRRLRCGCVTWLCNRFRLAWIWLVGSESKEQTVARQSASTVWRALCAEHAAPWRRLHTFERVARALRRLDEEYPSVGPQPVVLCLFLGSLLACPCRYITRTAGACEVSSCNSLARGSVAPAWTVASWSPDAEEQAWHRSARSLLAELQSNFPVNQPNEQGPRALESQHSVGEEAVASSGLMLDGSILEGRCNLLLTLLCEQRAASVGTLVTAARTADVVQGDVSAHATGNAAPVEQGIGELVRLTRRLEQLECTGNSVTYRERSQNLREEYFFIDYGYFSDYRTRQLVRLLETAGSLDCLRPQELLRARANIDYELELLRNGINARGKRAASSR